MVGPSLREKIVSRTFVVRHKVDRHQSATNREVYQEAWSWTLLQSIVG